MRNGTIIAIAALIAITLFCSGCIDVTMTSGKQGPVSPVDSSMATPPQTVVPGTTGRTGAQPTPSFYPMETPPYTPEIPTPASFTLIGTYSADQVASDGRLLVSVTNMSRTDQFTYTDPTEIVNNKPYARLIKSDPGYNFLILTFEVENRAGNKIADQGSYGFMVADSAGMIYQPGFLYDNPFPGGPVSPGGIKTGTAAFEIPEGKTEFKLIFIFDEKGTMAYFNL